MVAAVERWGVQGKGQCARRESAKEVGMISWSLAGAEMCGCLALSAPGGLDVK